MSNERTFLHAIANPLTTAQFVLDSILEDYRDAPNSDKALLEQLETASTALEAAVKLIRERREVLIKEGVPPGDSK